MNKLAGGPTIERRENGWCIVEDAPKGKLLGGPFERLEGAWYWLIDWREQRLTPVQRVLWGLALQAVKIAGRESCWRESDTLAAAYGVLSRIRRGAAAENVFRYAAGASWRVWLRRWEEQQPPVVSGEAALHPLKSSVPGLLPKMVIAPEDA